MSYWIYLLKHGKSVKVPKFEYGGTYPSGGTNEAEVNVTYNYAKHFKFRSLHGKIAKETIEDLETAIKELGTEKSEDYWESTPGNCGYTLSILLEWAKLHPTAKWEVH